MVGDDRALDLQQEEDPPRIVTECLEVALSLGDDQVRLLELIPELGAAVIEQDPWGVRSAVDDFHKLIESCRLRVGQRCIIDDGRSSDRGYHPRGGKLLNQQTVKNDLTSIVGYIEYPAGPTNRFAEFLDVAEERFLLCHRNRSQYFFLRELAVGSQVDDVACNCKTHGAQERIVRCFHDGCQLRQEPQCDLIKPVLDFRVRILNPGKLPQTAVNALRNHRGGLMQVEVCCHAKHLAHHLFVDSHIRRHEPCRVE